MVEPGHPRALRSSGGLVLTHYADAPDEPDGFPTRDLVVDACLFDLTMGEQPVAAVRGVETIHLRTRSSSRGTGGRTSTWTTPAPREVVAS